MFYLTTHSIHFIYGYMALDIWLRTILILRKETHCHHIGYSLRLTASVLLYAPSHRQDNTYHGLCYTSHGALAGTRNSSMGSPHEGSIRRPIATILTSELHLAPQLKRNGLEPTAPTPWQLTVRNYNHSATGTSTKMKAWITVFMVAYYQNQSLCCWLGIVDDNKGINIKQLNKTRLV